MKNIVLSLLLLLFPFCLAFGQDTLILKNNFGAELGGSGVFYSLYYEQVLVKKKNFRFNLKSGLTLLNNIDLDGDHRYFASNIAGVNIAPNLLRVSKKHAWEIGLAIGYQHFWGKDPDYDDDPGALYVLENWMHWLYVSPTIGYRRYSGNNRFYFRAAFTPVISLKTWRPPNDNTNYGAFPWASVGFGHALGRGK